MPQRTLTTAHGLCPKAPNNTTTFLRGDATYSTIPLGGYTLQNGVYVANTFSAVKPLYNIIEIYDEFTSYPGAAAAAGTPGSAIGTNGWSFYKLQLTVNAAATSVTAYANGNLIGTVTSDIPTANLIPIFFIGNQASATANYFLIDRFYYRYQVVV
jgi:hypothetical protein